MKLSEIIKTAIFKCPGEYIEQAATPFKGDDPFPFFVFLRWKDCSDGKGGKMKREEAATKGTRRTTS